MHTPSTISLSDLPEELVGGARSEDISTGVLCAAALNSSAVIFVSKTDVEVFVLELPDLTFRKVEPSNENDTVLSAPANPYINGDTACGVAWNSRKGAEVVVVERFPTGRKRTRVFNVRKLEWRLGA